MSRTVLFLLVWLLIHALPGGASPAASGRVRWKTLKTPAFTVFYPQERERQAVEILSVLENVRGYVEQTVGKTGGPIAVVLADLGIESNGLTDPVFRRMVLYPYSPSTGSLSTLQSWWRLLGVHEYTHWVHLSAASGLPGVLTAVFGNILAPNLLAPAWLLEGLCVYAESGLSPYEGRLNDGTFDAYVATLAREQALPSVAAATFQSSEFPGGMGPYLYGGVFFGYLADTYGEEALREFIDRTSSSVFSYLSPLLPAAGVDSRARKAFGKPFRVLWDQWREAEGRQASSFPVPESVLTARPGWLEAPVARNGLLYFRRLRVQDSRPLETRRVYELVSLDPDSGRERVLVRTPASFTGPLVVGEEVLYYALLDVERGFANTELSSYGFTAQVWELELATGRRRRLFRAPLRTFAVLGDGDVLCSLDRAGSFGSELRLFRRSEGGLQTLFETDVLVSEIHSGAAGLFVSARRDGESFGVYRVHGPGRLLESGTVLTGAALAGPDVSFPGLSAEELRLEPLADSPFSEGQLCLAGNRLYFSANPEGRHRIYGRDLESGRTAVADSLGYQSAPAFDPATGRLFALSLEAGGFTLCELADPLREVDPPGQAARRHEAEPPAGTDPLRHGTALPQAADVPGNADLSAWRQPAPPLPDDQIRRGGYLDNLATLLPRVLLPVLGFDSFTRTVQAGAAVLGRSALGDLEYLLGLFYDSHSAQAEAMATLRLQPAAPVAVELDFSSVGANSLGLTVVSPLYWSLTPGLWYVTAGAAARLFEEDFSRLAIAPLLGLGLRGPSTALEARLRLPLERLELGSDRNALALVGGLELVQALGPLEFRLEALGVESFFGSPTDLPPPPGYAVGLPALRGGYAGLDLWVPLVRIRRGLWNPGIHLDDLYAAVFVRGALNEAPALQLSYGGELHLELRALAAGTGVPVNAFVRVALTREGQPGLALGVQVSGLEDYVRGTRREQRWH